MKFSATKWQPSFICLLVMFGSLLVSHVRAEPKARTYSESQIKVALVYKLLHFVKLPESNLISLCVYKPRDEDVIAFKLMPPKTETASALTVKLIHQSPELIAPSNCQIVFLSEMTEGSTNRHLPNMAKAGLLTIGETEQFIKQGGMINLVRRGSTVKFEVNLNALKQAGLNISSQVLRIADQIYTKDSHD